MYIYVIVACYNSNGVPTFAWVKVRMKDIDFYFGGNHYDEAEKELEELEYEKPFVFFDEVECPKWLWNELLPEVRQRGEKEILGTV